ncbi:MAG: hypothetical protein R2788_06520 [Saprospiraceae bacterium]
MKNRFRSRKIIDTSRNSRWQYISIYRKTACQFCSPSPLGIQLDSACINLIRNRQYDSDTVIVFNDKEIPRLNLKPSN